MDDLSRLVNRLFCRQQDGDFLLQPHCLRELRRTDQRVHHVPQLVITRKACRELELRLGRPSTRSEEHTSELQSHHDLVCRLLLEKKKTHSSYPKRPTSALLGPPRATPVIEI